MHELFFSFFDYNVMPGYRRRRKWWKRRGYRRHRRTYIPKVLGSRATNIMRAQFNVETIADITIEQGQVYPKNPIFINPFIGVLIPESQAEYVSSSPRFLNSLFHSESFRKMMTIYSEVKLESMLVAATPLDFANRIGEFNTMTLFHTWDRKGKDFDGSSTFGSGVDASSKIKAASNEQGGKKTIIADTKGTFSHLTGCVAASMNEKSGWMDTHVVEGATRYIGENTTTRYAHTFVLVAENLDIANEGTGTATHMILTKRLSTVQPYFIPCLWITMMSNYPAVTSFTTRVMLRVKYTVLFRNPGPVDTGAQAISAMLTNNLGLAPSSTGWGIRSGNPDEKKDIYDDIDDDFEMPTKLKRTDTTMLEDE